MPFFEQNLAILKRRNPPLAEAVLACPPALELSIAEARSGTKLPIIEGRALHSKYDPAEEAARLVAAQNLSGVRAILVLGMGFGYHIDALLQATTLPMLVVERRIDILRAAMEQLDLERILRNTEIFCGSPPGAPLTAEIFAEVSDASAWALVPHNPSVRLAPAYYAAVENRLKRGIPPALSSRLRVMVVSPLQGGSYSVSRYAAAGLNHIGCDALFLDLHPFREAARYLDDSLKSTTVQSGMSGLFQRFLCEFVYWKIKELQPDLVLFLAQAPISAELLTKLRSENVQTAFWMVENYKLFTYWREIAPLFDHFFAIQQGEYFSELDGTGAFNHFHLPLACDPVVHRPVGLDPEDMEHYGSDLSAAGFGYYNRLHMMQGLTDFSLKLWGPGWDRSHSLRPLIQDGGAEFDAETMVKIYNASAINLNLHSSTHYSGVEPGGDFVNPRTFELAGCGAFQLSDERPPLADHFDVGSEIITFRNLAELREKARYYLEHPAERREIARRGRKRALAQHTYAIRMRRLLECLYPVRYIERRTARRDDPDLVAGLLEDLPHDHDLYPLLKQRPPDSKVAIEDLIAGLAGASAAPGREEITLRWIRNIMTEGLRQ